MQISVIIPLLNEEKSIPELYQWLEKVLRQMGLTYEVIFVDDGSRDGSWEQIVQLHQKNPQVRGIRFFKNYGKSQALHAGFLQAQGEVVITMDADLQDSPEEIPELYQMVTQQGFDLVSGWKKKRYDHKLTKNLPSKLFNWAARKTSGLTLHDFNCGLKAYRHEVVKNINVNGEMHRYIPVLAKNAGFEKITEKVVSHQARKYGETKFGAERFINGFLDLITISFISKFGKRPMHFFGALGVLMFLLGFGFAFYLGFDKLFLNPKNRLLTDRAEFFFALTSMLIGTQFFLAGFLGEMLLRAQQNKESFYHIKETTP